MRKNMIFLKDFIDDNWAISNGSKIIEFPVANALKKHSLGEMKEENVQSEYYKNVKALYSYCIGIMKSTLPVIEPAPKHYEAYQNIMLRLKADIQTWNSTVNSRLLSVPNTSLCNLKSVQNMCTDAIGYVQKLQKDTSSDYYRQKVSKSITNTKNDLIDISAEINSLIRKLGSFSNSLPAEVTQLENLVKLIAEDVAADQKEVASITAKINDLDNQISYDNGIIAATSIADLACIAITCYAFYSYGPYGAVTLVFTLPALCVSTGCMINSIIDLIHAKAEFEKKTAEKKQYDMAIAALQTQINATKKLIEATNNLKVNLQVISDEWNKVINNLNEMENEINSSSVHYDKEDWKSVESDFNKASDKCTELIEQIKKLDVSSIYVIDDKMLKDDMSKEEMQKIINTSERLSIVEYIREIG